MRFTSKAIAAAVAITAAAMAAASAVPASAATAATVGATAVSVSGGTATWNSAGTMATMTALYVPGASQEGYSQLQLINEAAPSATVAPTAVVNVAAGTKGDVRWELVFNKAGDTTQIVTVDGLDGKWTVGQKNVTPDGTYAEAYAYAQSEGFTGFQQAYIVDDGSYGNDPVTVTATYNGEDVVKYVPPSSPAAVPFVYAGHVLTVDNNRATVGWSESKNGWPNRASKCEEVWISGYGFGAWNGSDPGNAHVGFTCDNSNGSNANIGYLEGLAAGHTYALRIVPATGTYGSHTPIPGARVAYVDVFTTR